MDTINLYYSSLKVCLQYFFKQGRPSMHHTYYFGCSSIDLAAYGETDGYAWARKKRRLLHQRPYRICSISEMCLPVAEKP